MVSARRVTLVGCAGLLAAMHACSSDYITSDGGVDASLDGGGDGAACVVIPVSPAVPAHGGGACSADASSSTCIPGNETSFLPTSVPPPPSATPYPGICTAQQIDDFYTSCVAPAGTCPSFISNNTTCFDCLYSQSMAPRWGALVAANGTSGFLINFGACVGLVEPCNQPCANTYSYLMACSIDSCTGGAGCQDAGATAVVECLGAAPSCSACKGYADSVTGCGNELVDGGHPSVTACGLYNANLTTEIKSVATVLCGPPP